MRCLLILAPVLLITACSDPAAVRQATANSAATIYEAAVAIEQGVPPAVAIPAIKANAAAIVAAQGYAWPPPAAAPAVPPPPPAAAPVPAAPVTP